MTEKRMTYYAPVGNYYGTPFCHTAKGKFWIALENYDGEYETEISEEFFKAWIKEFPIGEEE